MINNFKTILCFLYSLLVCFRHRQGIRKNSEKYKKFILKKKERKTRRNQSDEQKIRNRESQNPTTKVIHVHVYYNDVTIDDYDN